MPTVISKLLEKGENTLQIPRSVLSGAVVATAILAYTCKVAYPMIDGYINKENKQHDSLNNNFVAKAQPVRPIPKKTIIPALNLRFIFQFIKLIRIMIPSPFCTETGLLTAHTTFLFLRTFLSIYVANLEGAIVKYIVRKEPQNFIKQLMKWFGVAIPATFINSMIRYLESRIAVSFRTRLVEHSYKLYFKDQSYYR